MAPFNAGNAPSYQDLSVKKPIHRARRRGSIRLTRNLPDAAQRVPTPGISNLWRGWGSQPLGCHARLNRLN